MKDFRTLQVWKKAHALTLTVYAATREFPADEKFGQTSQLKRCCISIEANIAEGCGRGSNQDFCRFLHMAMGSAAELDCHLLVARDLKWVNTNCYGSLSRGLHEVKSMLSALIRKIESDLQSRSQQ